MIGEPPAVDMDEMETVEAINKVSDKINRRDFSGLWIPTHLIHDCEMDDLLTWLLLTNIHRSIGSSLKTLIQLPKSKDMDKDGTSDSAEDLALSKDMEDIARKLKQAMSVGVDCQMFFDADARNAKAIKLAFGM